MANAAGIRFRVVMPRDDITGLSENLLDAVRDEAQENIRIGQGLVVDEVRKTLGRISAQPAAPGESPRKLVGELQESWVPGPARWRNKDQTIMQGAVQSKHPAAGALEYGAQDHGIHPHPYYRPTIARISRDLEGVLIHGDAWWRMS